MPGRLCGSIRIDEYKSVVPDQNDAKGTDWSLGKHKGNL